MALARRLSFGFKPGGLAQPLPGSKAPVPRLFKSPGGPEGRHTLDLDANQNLVTLGCVSPPGLAIHRDLQPVVTTTGKGCSSPPGLRKAKDIHLALARRFPFGYKPGDTHLAISPKTSIWIEARRAGTTSAGVEGPGSNAPQTATRPGGPIQPGFSWPSKSSEPWVCQPFGHLLDTWDLNYLPRRLESLTCTAHEKHRRPGRSQDGP